VIIFMPTVLRFSGMTFDIGVEADQQRLVDDRLCVLDRQDVAAWRRENSALGAVWGSQPQYQGRLSAVGWLTGPYDGIAQRLGPSHDRGRNVTLVG